VTVDLRDLGVTPEHQDTQAALAVLSSRVDAATDALVAARTDETYATWHAAWEAYDKGRRAFTNAAYETAYGPDPIDPLTEARAWLAECDQSLDPDDYRDETLWPDTAVITAVGRDYEGGWAAFVAGTRGGS
jgi:hypothetical protein